MLLTGFIVLFLVFFTQYINRDFNRLGQSFTELATMNKDKLDKTGQKIKEYIGSIYDFGELEEDLRSQADSLSNKLNAIDASQLDFDSIKAGFQEVTSIFKRGEKQEKKEKSGFGFLFMFFTTIVYFVLMLFEIEYFEGLRKKYFSHHIKSRYNVVANDFNKSFIRYFKLRSKIVLILSLLYITTFIILNIPGIILITLLIIILSYIPYLQYLALLPLSVGCLVLSVEKDPSFLVFFGIVLSVFILASIIEELILTPRIMEKNIGMNPVIMILSLSVWGYVMGLPGLLIGVPLTSLAIIYFKRYILDSYKEVLQE
jgi:predicted PurR-regulated permease PerM